MSLFHEVTTQTEIFQRLSQSLMMVMHNDEVSHQQCNMSKYASIVSKVGILLVSARGSCFSDAQRSSNTKQSDSQGWDHLHRLHPFSFAHMLCHLQMKLMSPVNNLIDKFHFILATLENLY